MQPAGEGVAGVCGGEVALRPLPSLRGALATKQSRLPPQKQYGLLRCARNDGVCGGDLPKILVPQLDRLAMWRPIRSVIPGITITMQRLQ
ncbi:hypothetical protein B5V03_38225 [Bradyrhizobium betae]|uniref:Uncharacterized protein n=1 Tax=Bradyrhizobium betae TaxID=244734 RepID=A0A4Q1UKX0_9BRAD|nr:hypothetical protein B5V03_38225 [Bradyrhizobium betae]